MVQLPAESEYTPIPLTRRGAWAVLTDAGRDARRSAWPVYGQGIQHHFVGRLDQADLDIIGRAMSRLAGEEGNPRYAGR